MRSFEFGVRSKKPFISIMLLAVWIGAAFAGQDQKINEKLAELKKLQGRFTFVVLGDNRSGDDVYAKLLQQAVERKPAFIVNTGDQIATPGDLTQWAAFWRMSRIATMPYFLTVGNHDVHPMVPGSEAAYKDQVDLPGNELYYSFVVGTSLFVVLDTQIDGQEKKVTGEQMRWLSDVLTRSLQRHKFIFLHHPLYPEKGRGKHHGNSLDRYPEERDALQALFVKHQVTAVFTGHEHLYLRKTVDTVRHIITGGGGAPLYAEDDNGGFHHYILVTVDGDKVSAEVIDDNGKVRERFEFGVRSEE